MNNSFETFAILHSIIQTPSPEAFSFRANKLHLHNVAMDKTNLRGRDFDERGDQQFTIV